MLKMMAADNDDAYNLTPAFILETVEVAREFIRKQSKSVGNVTNGRNSEHHLHVQVAAFLAWPQERVKHALAQLAAFEPDEETKEPTLSREAVKQLPTLHAATALHREVFTPKSVPNGGLFWLSGVPHKHEK